VVAYYDSVFKKSTSGGGKKWFRGNGESLLKNMKKRQVKVKQSANG
jgi:hypothetical protein